MVQLILAVLVSFVYIYETKALDDALNLLDVLITEIIAKATRLGQQRRMRSMGDLDNAALSLSNFVELFIKHESSTANLVGIIYKSIPKDFIVKAMETIREIARPNNNKYYEEQVEQYKTVRRFLPMLLNVVEFQATIAGKPILDALKFLNSMESKRDISFNNAPLEIVNSGWRNIVINAESEQIDRSGYILCAIDNLQINLRSRDLFIETNERWCDPRAKLFKGEDWDKYKNPVCYSLNLSVNFDEAFNKLSTKLDNTYQAVVDRLPDNNAISIIESNNKSRIKLSKLEKTEEPDSLTKLKAKIARF